MKYNKYEIGGIMMDNKENPKRRQSQPRHHAAKSKEACKLRRKKILKGLMEGKTQKQAGIEAGLSPRTADKQVSAILQEPRTLTLFKALLDKAIPDEKQAEKYRELLEATKVISAIIINGNSQDANSMTKDFIEVPDYPTQLKANDSISKLKGHLVEANQTNVQINFESLTDRQLEDIIEGKVPKDL